MVKHCLTIYDECNDAWERVRCERIERKQTRISNGKIKRFRYFDDFQAQTEELAVFKKCNTPNIYKSSALLTINKLRKESLGEYEHLHEHFNNSI